MPTTLTDAQQHQRLRRQVDAFLAGLDEFDGEKLLLVGYESWRYDPTGTIEYNKESVEVRPDGQARVQAVMHRPLREGCGKVSTLLSDFCSPTSAYCLQ